jgi:hypothetical protein
LTGELDSEFTGMSFDDGYRLAELESVGTPTIEIDDDLDRRLLEAAENASASMPVEDVTAGRDIHDNDDDEVLPEYRRWIPAGSWVSQASLQDELIRNWIPAVRSSRPLEAESDVVDDAEPSDGIGIYEICIPAAEDPTPVWPPERSHLGPASAIPVSELNTNVAPHQPASLPRVEPEITVAAGSPTEESSETSDIGFSEDPQRWADGQLLTSTGQQADGVGEVSFEEDSDPSNEAVRLKIAELEDQSDEVETPEVTTSTSDSQQLFTLPIALDAVTGECEPLADSVREIQRDLDDFQGVDRGTSLHTPIQGPLPKSPQAESTRSSITEMSLESALRAATESETELSPPQWISRTRQVVSAATPVAQLRPAAGAESYNLTHDTANLPPALSVPDWSTPCQDDSSADEGRQETSVTDEPVCFRNLFTRIRRIRS